MNIKRLILRSRKYYSEGNSLISLPITFLGFSRTLYGLVDGLPFMDLIFPTFQRFLVIGGIGLLPFSMLVGYIWIRSRFYKESMAVGAENNPYAFRLAPGRDSKMFFGQIIGQQNMLRLFKQFNTFEPGEEEKYKEYIDLMIKLDQGGII